MIGDIKTKVLNRAFSRYYFGEVIDLNDELHAGYVKVKVYGLTEGLKNDELPWYRVEAGLNARSMPNKGDIVLLENRYDDLMELVVIANISGQVGGQGVEQAFKGEEKEFIEKAWKKFNKNKEWISTYPNSEKIAYPYKLEQLHKEKGTTTCEPDTSSNPYGDKYNDKMIEASGCEDYEAGFEDGVYIWYDTEQGGWRLYTEKKEDKFMSDWDKGVFYIQDDFTLILKKRYDKWVNEFPLYTQLEIPPGLDRDWKTIDENTEFFKCVPWAYVDKDHHHPQSANQVVASFGMSFPLAKYKLKDREYWKQSVIYSTTMKTRIEMDDNDGYERFLLWFNDGNSYFEISTATNNAEFLTNGDFLFYSKGQTRLVSSGNILLKGAIATVDGGRAHLHGTGRVEIQSNTGNVDIKGMNIRLYNNARQSGIPGEGEKDGADESGSLHPLLLYKGSGESSAFVDAGRCDDSKTMYLLAVSSTSDGMGTDAIKVLYALKAALMMFGLGDAANSLTIVAVSPSDPNIVAQEEYGGW